MSVPRQLIQSVPVTAGQSFSVQSPAVPLDTHTLILLCSGPPATNQVLLTITGAKTGTVYWNSLVKANQPQIVPLVADADQSVSITGSNVSASGSCFYTVLASGDPMSFPNQRQIGQFTVPGDGATHDYTVSGLQETDHSIAVIATNQNVAGNPQLRGKAVGSTTGGGYGAPSFNNHLNWRLYNPFDQPVVIAVLPAADSEIDFTFVDTSSSGIDTTLTFVALPFDATAVNQQNQDGNVLVSIQNPSLVVTVDSPNTALKSTATTVSSGSATALPASALANRRGMIIANIDAAITVYIGDSSVTSATGVPLLAGASMPANVGPTNIVYAIAASGSPKVVTFEAS